MRRVDQRRLRYRVVEVEVDVDVVARVVDSPFFTRRLCEEGSFAE